MNGQQPAPLPGLPIGEVLPGIAIPALPEHAEPIAAIVLVKARDAEGTEGWYARVTHNWDRDEGLGVLISYTDNLRRESAAAWEDTAETAAPE